MTCRTPSEGVPGTGRTAPGTAWSRLGTGGLAVVLAVTLFGCTSAGTEESPAQDNGSASATGSQNGSKEPGDGSAGENGAAAEDEDAAEESEARAAEAFRASGASEPGEPAVVEDDGTGEEERATTETVSLGEEAQPADGLEIVVESTRPVTAEGMGPGGMSGPAIAVVVTVHNSTDAPVSTLGGSVTVTYGPDERPAAPSRQPDDISLPVEVAPGETVSGTYTFLVPEDQRDDLVITASYRATDPAAVFAGPALGEGADG
ncbi:hypothetical protein ACH9DO_05960 [Kocuria sp. M1N1S27]|uniref:hypothetical protein n=1 Tax=Kocuria kalidii TaxID=3376283 RepID=UPI0037ACA078